MQKTLAPVAIFLLLSAPAFASIINFDDIDASAGDVILGSYQGYSWTNFSAYTSVPGFPGFNNGIVSQPNAAYSSGLGEITAASPFDLSSVYLGSGYYDNLAVTVEGFLGGTQYYSQTVTVSTTGAQLFSFDFTGIDTLIFSAASTASTTDPYDCGPVGCTYLTLDDIGLTPDSTHPPPPISEKPEPSTLTLLLPGGALALLSLRRHRRSHQ